MTELPSAFSVETISKKVNYLMDNIRKEAMIVRNYCRVFIEIKITVMLSYFMTMKMIRKFSKPGTFCILTSLEKKLASINNRTLVHCLFNVFKP